ncbi:MAG: sulfite exporter TauE/SafE family protein [Bacteroidetes bacterium]|nr:sulfite exporter TauE/SafE family protein [Bacteroidota bacterium]
MDITTLLGLIAIGLIAGTLSGLFGVGGGVIIVPALVFFMGFNQQAAQGTSLGLMLLPVGILAVMNYYQKGHIDVKVVSVMVIAFVIGGYIGSKWALALPQETLKKIFAVILFYTGIRMLGWDQSLVQLFKKAF